MSDIAAGRAVVETLRRLGTRVIFGIPGGQTLFVTDALYDQDAIRFVTTRHEGTAACAADGYGRFTGTPGVALATTGPGATNLLTGVGGAFRDSSPTVLLVCNNRSEHLAKDDTQAADHVAIFRPLTKWATLVTDAAQIPDTLTEAFRVALSGRPGPVLVDLARDVVEEGQVPLASVERVVPIEPPKARGADADVRAAAEVLARARRPIIWAGRGAVIARAGDAILALADALDAPVLTTFNGIGAVPNTHPRSFGPLSRSGSQLAAELLAEADVVLTIGNSLNGATTGHWSLKLPRLVQVDVDPERLSEHYPAEATVLGDADLVTRQLTQAILVECERDAGAAGERAARTRTLQERRRAWRERVFNPPTTDAGVRPEVLMRTLRDVAPSNTVFCVDAGNPGIWTHLLEIREPGTYMKPVGFGNMGFALGAAIGTKVAAPDRPVVAVIGDGSLGMTLAEIETTTREKTPITVLLMNNQGYGNIRQEERYKFGGPRYIGVDFIDVDYPAMARAMGADGERVCDTAALAPALERALAHGGTYLVDVRLDEPNVWMKPF